MSSSCDDIPNSQPYNFSSRVGETSESGHSDLQTSPRQVNVMQSYGEVSSTNLKPEISVARRNERERKRVRLVNQGFAILRDKVPRDKCNRGRRSSKVETLRAAIMYIRQLQQMLLENQTRFHEQNPSQCYAYFGGETLLNEPVASTFDSYAFNNGFSSNIMVSPSYHQYGSSVDMQCSSEVCERQLMTPWFV